LLAFGVQGYFASSVERVHRTSFSLSQVEPLNVPSAAVGCSVRTRGSCDPASRGRRGRTLLITSTPAVDRSCASLSNSRRNLANVFRISVSRPFVQQNEGSRIDFIAPPTHVLCNTPLSGAKQPWDSQRASHPSSNCEDSITYRESICLRFGSAKVVDAFGSVCLRQFLLSVAKGPTSGRQSTPRGRRRSYVVAARRCAVLNGEPEFWTGSSRLDASYSRSAPASVRPFRSAAPRTSPVPW